MKKVGFFASGVKGFGFLRAICHECIPVFVSSHAVKGLAVDVRAEVTAFCQANGYPFVEPAAVNDSLLEEVDVLFIAGWQYLVRLRPEKLVVFHDSLLPRYRGFAPTIAALIEGEPEVGVTAFRPVAVIDAGPIYAQARMAVAYPIKIRDVYAQLAQCYRSAALEVLVQLERGELVGRSQCEEEATYSIWRDESDYFVDWNWSAERIKRFIDALGWPYAGARTRHLSQVIRIDDAELLPEVRFVERQPGKIWAVHGGGVDIVCGSGMLRVLSASAEDGSRIAFKSLRQRLG